MTSSFDQFLTDAKNSKPPQVDNLVSLAEDIVLRSLQKTVKSAGFAMGVSLTVVPGEQQGSFQPLLVIVISGPSPILGDRIIVNLLSFDMHPTQEGMDDLVTKAVEEIHRQQSQVIVTPTV